MSGQLVIVLVPSASSAAAISLRTLFLAPPTATSPDNRLPPVTTKCSATRVSLVKPYRPVSRLGQSDGYVLFMAVHLTRIYTRTGDDGTTGLSDFSRVSKNDTRLVAYADCDEANAAIGTAIALGAPEQQIADVLRQIQNDLFDAGADLVDAGRREPGASSAAHHAGLRRPTRNAGATSSTQACLRSNPLCCLAVRRSRPCCTSPARWRDALSVRPGLRSSSTRRTSARCPRST